MTIRRSRNPLATQDALLVAAESLFASQGFSGTRTDDIARVSGVNKAMINYYFGGKSGLYKAMIDRALAPALGKLEELRNEDRPAPERLTEFIRLFAELHMKNPNLSVILLREILTSEGRSIDEGPLPAFLEIFGTVRSILEQGQRDGTLRVVPIPQAHLAMMGGLFFFFASRRFRARVAAEGKFPFIDIPPEHFVDFFCGFATRGLSPAQADRPKPNRATPNRATPDRAKSGQAKSDRAKPGQAKSGQAKSGQAKPNRVGRDHPNLSREKTPRAKKGAE